jgi:uncharacterized protein (DUF1684 family)
MSTIVDHEDLSRYVADVESWRSRLEADLRAPDGWLSLAGLFDLTEGEQTIGSDNANDIVLPPDTPAQLGVIVNTGGQAHLTVTTDVPVLVDGAVSRQADLIEDGDGARTPTKVTVGAVTFFVHTYGDKRAIRVKDSNSPMIRSFRGRRWFEVKPEYCVPGRFVPYDSPLAMRVGSVAGNTLEYPSAGEIEFELHGQRLRLATFGTPRPGPRQVFVLFRDATSGKQTHPAQRAMNVKVDADGNAEVDFNKAHNMPCAFTPYATCPLPPQQNILSIPIEAGERRADAAG